MDAPKEIFLKDYKKPDYFFDKVDLKFSLGEDKTIVSSRIAVVPRVEGNSSPLTLDGHDLKLVSIKVNGTELKHEDIHLTSRHLTLPSPPTGTFTLEIVTEIHPQSNTSLEGLYKSSGNFCTQCEAEGFRKITYYQGGSRYALWEDPFKKPCYLFALVAGQLKSRDDTFVTRSGRKLSMRIWTPAQDVPKTAHAMHSLKATRKWDEEVLLVWNMTLISSTLLLFRISTCEPWKTRA